MLVSPVKMAVDGRRIMLDAAIAKLLKPDADHPFALAVISQTLDTIFESLAANEVAIAAKEKAIQAKDEYFRQKDNELTSQSCPTSSCLSFIHDSTSSVLVLTP